MRAYGVFLSEEMKVEYSRGRVIIPGDDPRGILKKALYGYPVSNTFTTSSATATAK